MLILVRSISLFPEGILLRKGYEVCIMCAIQSTKGENRVSTGTVKWFNERKGFGFIIPEEGGDDLFFHHSEIQSEGKASLNEGQKVEYEAGTGEKGRPCAVKVRPS